MDMTEEDLNTIRNDREHTYNIEKKKSGRNQNRNIAVDHMVDSYEIYGENNPDEES